MAVIHLAGAIASFLLAGYLLIDSVFGMGLGNWGLISCFSPDIYGGSRICHNVGILMTKFAIGIVLLVFGTWIAYRSRN